MQKTHQRHSDTSARCPLCGSGRHAYAFSERGHDLLRCLECELFFINPYPTSDTETYATVADYAYDELEIVDTERHYRSSQLYYRRYFPWIEPELSGARAVLDIGCGTGRLLELLADRPQLTRVGLELNSKRAAFARQQAGCAVHEVPVEQFTAEQPFDVIFMMNVLSHVPQLAPFFAAVRRLLTPEGKLILKVGEMAPHVRKHAVHDWSIPDHLHFLGMGTMEILARQFGFRIVRHVRQPLSAELFAVDTWRAPGRSSLRNLLKRTTAAIPLALPLLAKVYDRLHGRTIYTSLVVLSPAPDTPDAG